MMETDDLVTKFFGKDGVSAEAMSKRTFECRKD